MFYVLDVVVVVVVVVVDLSLPPSSRPIRHRMFHPTSLANIWLLVEHAHTHTQEDCVYEHANTSNQSCELTSNQTFIAHRTVFYLFLFFLFIIIITIYHRYIKYSVEASIHEFTFFYRMGFSVQNKHYAPNGNGTGGCSGGISGTDGSCARKVVNSVFNSMASSFNSVANVGSNSSTTLMNHIRSWQRSRRLRSLNKTHSTSVVNPMNNLCYQSMLPKSSIDLTNSSSSDFNFYRTMNHNHHHIDNNNGTRTDPVVSFMNKGEGVIAMQLVNPRVMINENQLYSMNLANESNNFEMSHRDPLRQTLSDGSCYMELELPSTLNANESKGTKDETLINEIWYYGNISREKAIQVVQNCATGSFVVRNSCTKESCFALTVRVPYDYNHNGVAHYLIIPTDGGRYKIKV